MCSKSLHVHVFCVHMCIYTQTQTCIWNCIYCWITGLLGDQIWLPGNPVCMWNGKWWDHSAFAQKRPACLGGERQTERGRGEILSPRWLKIKHISWNHVLMCMKQAENLNLPAWNQQAQKQLRWAECKNGSFYPEQTWGGVQWLKCIVVRLKSSLSVAERETKPTWGRTHDAEMFQPYIYGFI